MTPRTQLDSLFAQWALPFTATAAAAHGARMREVAHELQHRLAHNDTEVSRWIDAQRPALGSCAHEVLQRTISRVSTALGPLTIDACAAFCPVTIVLTTTQTELPTIDVELFRNTRPQAFIDALLAHGLVDDCNVSVDPLMLPASRVARIGLSELPAIVRSMTDAATLAKSVDGAHGSCVPHPNDGMPNSVSIAGGRVIGSLLIPLLFFADDLGHLPDVLNGNVPAKNLVAFRLAASEALTVTLGRWGPVRINFFVSAPALILDALLESTSAHCDTAAYWASRAALELGGTECRIVYNDTPDNIGGGLSVGFVAGQDVECNVRMFATGQDDLDIYTDAFAAGAHAAGMSTVRTAMHPAPDTALN